LPEAADFLAAPALDSGALVRDAASAAAFSFFEFGIEALQDSRIDERMVGQLQAVLKSEDDADKHVVVRGA
jgi:hypothetical protein